LLWRNYRANAAKAGALTAFGVWGISFICLVPFSCAFCSSLFPAAVLAGVPAAMWGTLVGVGIAVNGRVFNDELRIDLQHKILTRLMVVPHGQETRLIFMRPLQRSFALTIRRLSDGHEIPFSVRLIK
jgi:hypothetical protein